MKKSLAALLLAAIAVAPQASSAAPITVPTGLNPGDQYRLAFVTSTTRDATSSNIADYNSFVTTAANSVPELVALGTIWKAIGSTSTVAARDNTGTNPVADPVGVPIYQLADGIIASSNADLWDLSIASPLGYTEQGTLVSSGTVWTGTNGSGFAFDPLGGGFFVVAGSPTATSFSWIDFSGGANTSLRPLYAMSGVLTVGQDVPEPGTMVLACLAAVGLAFSLLHRRSCSP